MDRPLYVYDNWSSYDELSDNVPLTEELAMQQFQELLRLKSFGVKMDAYLMDAFWYSPDGQYIEWRKDRWPKGPDAWLNACRENGILPGLWFTANTNFHFEPPAAWLNSLAADEWGFCLFHGGFWKGFLEKLDYWYERGVRVFKFDFADFGAAPDFLKVNLLPSEIRSRNIAAYRAGLLEFRASHPECVLLAYNGFEEVEFMNRTDLPLRRVLDPAWLAVFDTVYCGDPRPADNPLPFFWRTLDAYADHMVGFLNMTGLRLDQIDNCAFMIGNTGTCYRRGKAGWKSTLLLSLARGGKVHMTLGNLEALSYEDAKWFAKAQALYEGEDPKHFGAMGGRLGESYGYKSANVTTVVNATLKPHKWTPRWEYGELAYYDGWISQREKGGSFTLGVGSVAVFSKHAYDLGHGDMDRLPKLRPLVADWTIDGKKGEITIPAPRGHLHIVFQQRNSKGAVRTSGGAPPTGKSMAELIKIFVTCNGQSLPVTRPDDHVIWSGLSWAWGIVTASAFAKGDPLTIRLEWCAQEVTTPSFQLFWEA